MSEDQKTQKVKTPLMTVLDMAKGEIKERVFMCMECNNIPPELMAYVIKDVLLDVLQMKSERAAAEFVGTLKTLQAGEEKNEKNK